MKERNVIAKAGVLLSLILSSFVAGCVVGPAEGYYDHPHHRYYHEHAWHACDPEHDGDVHYCR